MATLKRGDCLLELIQYYAPPGNKKAPRLCDVGCMHMALEVDNIHALYGDLNSRGVEFLSPPNRLEAGWDWSWWCYCRDPDGVAFELVQVSP